jgi:hypothetical protein
MSFSHKDIEIDFDGPTTYRIAVKGRIDECWSEYLGGLQIGQHVHDDEPPITILCGQVVDQGELMGVLNAIYEMHMPILWIEKIPAP